MNINELSKEILRAEVEFVRPMLEVKPRTAASVWNEGSPVCDDYQCDKCPGILKGNKGLCERLSHTRTVHAAAREYLAALEAAIEKKEGAMDV